MSAENKTDEYIKLRVVGQDNSRKYFYFNIEINMMNFYHR